MKLNIIYFCLFLLLFSTINGQEANELREKIASLINPLVQTNNYSGNVLIRKKDSIVFQSSYGKMSHEFDLNTHQNTKFFLASVSMIFTSAAIMKLHEEGKLDINDTLDHYFPWYRQGDKITIHQMLAQRSGIPAIGHEKNVSYDSITKFTHTAQTLIDYFKDYELLFEPGTKYNHGRSEYILLAHLIEKLSGKSFGDYLKDEIFIPLNMTNSGHYSGEKEIVHQLAKGYAPKGTYDLESAYQIDWSAKTGHASIHSTVSDLQKFVLASLENKLLSAASWEQILKNHGNNVGYGWFIRDHLNKKRYQMNGRSPGFSSYLAVYPEEELVIIVLSNNYISLPATIGMSLAAIYFNEPYDTWQLSKKQLSDVASNKLVGKYQFDENFYVPNHSLEIKEENGNIFCEWGPLLPLEDANGKSQDFIIRTFWSSIRFIENDKGEIIAMLFDEHEGIKVP